MQRLARLPAFFWSALVGAMTSPLAAQDITRDNYFDYLPPPGRLVSQTRATARLHLFGDRNSPSFSDLAPADGIDDTRAARLLQIAERFSPIIRPNNFSVPRDPRAVLGPQQRLMSDLWVNGRRVNSDTILLEQRAAETGLTQQSDNSAQREKSDLLLARLLSSHGPRSFAPLVEPAEADSDRVLFFDFPGSEPKTWRASYQRLDPRSGSRVFAHPFLSESPTAAGDARYQLVVQFWFFYPFNDGANAHEGDWEGVNVVATTRERAAKARTADQAMLSAADIQSVLSPDYPVDSLVVAAAFYFIHQHVLTLDYLALGSPEPAPTGTVADAHYAWEDVDYARRAIRGRLSTAGGKLATHPLVYVGGDNKGAAELLAFWPRFGKSLRRNSGASFPFPGIWQTVAGFAVTEGVQGEVVPRLHADTSLAWHELIADDAYLTYRASEIVVLPDWEELLGQLETNADFRREWGWFVLPIRWGFPVSKSPAAGFVKHTNVGNIAPMGLAYHAAWNRIGATTEHFEYRVRVLRTPVSPNTPWAVVKNGWGFLNVPLAVWGLMPGFNVGLIQLMPWVSGGMHLVGAPPRRTFTPDRLPRRFTTEGQGIFREFGGRDFAGVLSRADTVLAASRGVRENQIGPRFWFNLHFGDHFSLENTYSWSTSDIAYDASNASGTWPVTGSLEMRQLTGGIRYDVLEIGSEDAHIYARGGYGWLWYRASDERINGQPSGISHEREGYFPTILPSRHWMPNTLYAGAGLEAFSPRRYWLFGLLGYGVRVEYSGFAHRLHYDDTRRRGDVTSLRGDLATSLVFGW
ncbi:MAG: hypothetical protein WD825_01895 [Gemmatimonadaceae bacterium]